MKLVIERSFKTKKILNSITTIEQTYKAIVSNVMRNIGSRKVLPDSLAYLPLYMLGVLKHRVCCKDEIGYKLDYDLSNYLRIKLLKLSHFEVMSFIFPRIYKLHNILDDNTIGEYTDNVMKLPEVR